MERPARAAFVGAIVAALITLPALGAGTLWDNSETAYGEVAREVLLSHDWIVMHLNAAPWFVQPPLYFWIGALFIKGFGLTSFALRLPSALATIVMGSMTGYAVARQVGTRIGIYASVILSSSLMQAIIGRLAIMDALLDVAVALTVFWWFRALEAGRDRYFIYGWIAAGFGFLAKGPVAPVVSLIVIVPFVLWNNRVERLRLPSLRVWILALRIRARHSAVADSTWNAKRPFFAYRNDRALHRRPLHRCDREPSGTRVVLPPGGYLGVFSVDCVLAGGDSPWHSRAAKPTNLTEYCAALAPCFYMDRRAVCVL